MGALGNQVEEKGTIGRMQTEQKASLRSKGRSWELYFLYLSYIFKRSRKAFSTSRSRRNSFVDSLHPVIAAYDTPRMAGSPAALKQSLVHLQVTIGEQGLRTVLLINPGGTSTFSLPWQKVGFSFSALC